MAISVRHKIWSKRKAVAVAPSKCNGTTTGISRILHVFLRIQGVHSALSFPSSETLKRFFLIHTNFPPYDCKTNLGSPHKTFIINDYDCNSIIWASTFRVGVGWTMPDGHPDLRSLSGQQTRPAHWKCAHLMTSWLHSPQSLRWRQHVSAKHQKCSQI